jgi:hypothetical protein
MCETAPPGPHVYTLWCLNKHRDFTLTLFPSLQVDKHIRRLDSDLARFEAEIQDKALSNSRNQEDSVSTKSMVFAFTSTN